MYKSLLAAVLCVGIVMGGGEADLPCPSHPTIGMQGWMVGGGGIVT
jgi:hypothetical protein